MPPKIESSQEIQIQIPSEFDDIKNQKYFAETYNDLVSRYGNNFDEKEIGIIKFVRINGRNEYKSLPTPKKLTENQWKRILSNRMDKGIFEHRYPEFIELDKNVIRKINNADKQREMRAAAINKVENKYHKKTGELDIKISQINEEREVELNQQLIPHKKDLEDLKATIKAQNNTLETQINKFKSKWPDQKEIEEMKSLKINNYFESVKNTLFNGDYDWNKYGNQKYVECLFNKYAYEIGNLFELDNDDIDESLNNKIFTVTITHLDLISQGIEHNPERLISDVSDTIIGHDPKYMKFTINKLVSYTHENQYINDLYDESDYLIDNGFTEEEIRIQKEYMSKIGIDWKDYTKITIIHKKLNQIQEKIDKGEELRDREKNFWENFKKTKSTTTQNTDITSLHKEIKNITNTFNLIYHKDGKGIIEFIKLYELQEIQRNKNEKNAPRQGDYNIANEKIEGDMSSLNPDTIVRYNNDIHNYIFRNDENEYYATFDKDISQEYRKTLFKKLIKEHKQDMAFQESIKYMDEYGNINEEKVKEDHIERNSIEKNYQTINKMIHDLAEKEFQDKEKINKINNICTKKCIMSTCFRALSRYFDKPNDNGENFAAEFEIQDINENISFDEETGIIKMTGKIKGDNYIGIYYDTKNGELYYDNFLGYNSNVGYIMGKNSGEKEKVGIKLPTMKEMERQSEKIDKDLIYKLSINTPQYINTLSKSIKNSLRLGCFQGFIGTTMDYNRQTVQKFNEKNILKQDILKSIYTKYYDEDSVSKIMEDKLVIDANSPEQYKLVELISNSINACTKDENINENKLLKFRNLINRFDNILENNPKLIEQDNLLSVLFGDNKNNGNDIYDNSKKIMQQENPTLSITQKENNINYSKYIGHQSSSNSLNYYIFLDLLSVNGTIDLYAFNDALNTIEKEGKQLLEKQDGILWTNYLLKVAQGDLPNITNTGNNSENPSPDKSNLDAELERKLEEIH